MAYGAKAAPDCLMTRACGCWFGTWTTPLPVFPPHLAHLSLTHTLTFSVTRALLLFLPLHSYRFPALLS